jgi:hypothetical protein
MMDTSGIGFDYKAEIPSMNVGSNIEASGIGYRAEIPSMNIGSNIEA